MNRKNPQPLHLAPEYSAEMVDERPLYLDAFRLLLDSILFIGLSALFAIPVMFAAVALSAVGAPVWVTAGAALIAPPFFAARAVWK